MKLGFYNDVRIDWPWLKPSHVPQDREPPDRLSPGVALIMLGSGWSAWAGFSAIDLAGTWYFGAMQSQVSQAGQVASWGTLEIGSTGSVASGSYVEYAEMNPGVGGSITGGAFTLDGLGQVSGYTVNLNGTTNHPHGKLDAGKTLLTVVNWAADWR